MDLNQVTLPAIDLTRSVQFYEQLGLKLIVLAEHYARFEMPSGSSTLSLHVSERVTGSDTTLYFELDDIDGTVSRLKEQGISFDHEPMDQSWLWREARLTDPAGNKLCLYHAGPNRRFPPWRRSPRPA